MKVRALTHADAKAAILLYADLMGDNSSGDSEDFAVVLSHPGTQVFGAELNARIVAIATLHVLPNMTFAARPYALIENVVSANDFRGRGGGRAVMEHAIDAAWNAGCYKIMLLTGRTYGARGFYERLGFTAEEKWGMTLRRAPQRQAKK